MQTSPLETQDILQFLAAEKRLDESLRQQLQRTVRRYRLDQPLPGDGRRCFARRTYTCPFFEKADCTLSRTAKPYGCLGFNPGQAAITEGGNCHTDTLQLQAREAQFARAEQVLNQQLKQDLLLDWEKKPMPVALLEMMDKIGTLRRETAP